MTHDAAQFSAALHQLESERPPRRHQLLMPRQSPFSLRHHRSGRPLPQAHTPRRFCWSLSGRSGATSLFRLGSSAPLLLLILPFLLKSSKRPTGPGLWLGGGWTRVGLRRYLVARAHLMRGRPLRLPIFGCPSISLRARDIRVTLVPPHAGTFRPSLPTNPPFSPHVSYTAERPWTVVGGGWTRVGMLRRQAACTHLRRGQSLAIGSVHFT